MGSARPILLPLSRGFGDPRVLGPIDWENGWRAYWEAAGTHLGSGTDYSPDRLGIEVQAFFPDETQWSHGFGVSCELSDEEIWSQKAVAHLEYGLNGDVPRAALIGIVTDDCDGLSRPCLTLIVTGPGGGRKAAMMIAQMVRKNGLPLACASVLFGRTRLAS